MRSVAILGPGGVGGFLAAALARAGHDVTVVAREPTAEALRRDGIRVRSLRLGDFEAHPAAAAELAGPVDALVVATKAVGLDKALARVSGLEPRIVLPLLNGLDHLSLLRERYGSRAVAGAIRIESTRVRTGEIEQTSPFLRIDTASADPAMAAPLGELAELFDAAEVPVRVMDSEAQAMWEKLVRLNAVACTTSAWDLPLGRDPRRPGAPRRARGVRARGRGGRPGRGRSVEPADTIAELEDAHAGLRTSMQRDIAAGRAPSSTRSPGRCCGRRPATGSSARRSSAWPASPRNGRESPLRWHDPAAMRSAKALFWASSALIVHTHVGYPAAALLLARGRRDAARPRSTTPPRVALIVAAYNEGTVIARKVENALRARLSGSARGDRRLRRLHRRHRRARAPPAPTSCSTSRAAARFARRTRPSSGRRGEIVAFSDANACWQPDALRRLVAPFADPRVGYVCGQVRFTNEGGDNQEGLYWRYEMWIRALESRARAA